MQHTSNHSESIRSFIGKKLAIFFRHEDTTFFINNQNKNSFLSKTAHFFEQDEDFLLFFTPKSLRFDHQVEKIGRFLVYLQFL